ncbi:MAG: tetratricopeptide repeat protein [Sphingomonadales bacterium]|jgi:tetratricopeptide (TPR) repeat protein
MKKWSLIMAACLMAHGSWAQMSKVKSAFYAIEGEKSNSAGDVLEGKNYIDDAFKDPKTANNNRMWLARAMVYSRVFNMRGNELLKETSAGSGLKSGYSMMQFIKSTDKKLPDDVDLAALECATSFGVAFNESEELLGEKKYDDLLEYYKIIIFLYDEMVKIDTATINSLERQNIKRKFLVDRLANLALVSSNPAIKKEVLQSLIDQGSNSTVVFEAMSKVYMESGDTAGAERVIRLGLERAPGDNNMFQVLVNYFVSINKVDKLMDDVNKQIETNPDSKWYYTRAYLNEKGGKYDACIADYQKAVELDEFNYDAQFNLGLALMKYESKKFYDQMAKANAAKMKEINAGLTALFGRARAHLEKASENSAYGLNDQINIYKALKQCAVEMGDKASADAYGAQVKNLESIK